MAVQGDEKSTGNRMFVMRLTGDSLQHHEKLVFKSNLRIPIPDDSRLAENSSVSEQTIRELAGHVSKKCCSVTATSEQTLRWR
jgi:hypothetical protein